MAATVRLQLEPDIVDMDREMRAQERAGPQLWLLTTYLSYLLFCLPEALNELLPDEVEGITKEEDDAIMRAKQRQVMVMVETLMMMMIVVTLQMFLDDVGVTIAMITVTLLAVVVVVLKVLLFSDKVQPSLTLRVTANPRIAAGPECVHVLAAGAAGEVQHPLHGQGLHPV